jgi:hypothetical protein
METNTEVPTPVVANHIHGLSTTDCEKLKSKFSQEFIDILFKPRELSDLNDKKYQNTLTEIVKSFPEIDFVYKFDLPEYKETRIFEFKDSNAVLQGL